jgi:hypothetical protein
MTSSFRLCLAMSAAALALATSGCSVFRGSKRVDMQPFAENTVTAIGEMRKMQTPPVWIRLRPYLNHPSVLETRKAAAPLFALVRGVNIYSLQVVSLNDSPISERNKSRELAKFLHGASQQALLNEADEAEIALTPDRREALLKSIGDQETFREALEAAEPIVNAVLARGLDLSDALDASILAAGRIIEVEIQTQAAPMLANRAALVALQEKNMQAQAWAESLEFGDEAAADQLARKAIADGVKRWLLWRQALSRWLEVRGQVIEMTRDGADAHADKLTQRYCPGKQYFYRDIYPPEQKEKETRVIVKIQPLKVSMDAIFR